MLAAVKAIRKPAKTSSSPLLVDNTGDDYPEPVAAWIAEHLEYVDTLTELSHRSSRARTPLAG
jgi:hypothetical protein